ncbi:hypothetical protein VPHD164_0040 [Vibrio phage D164]
MGTKLQVSVGRKCFFYHTWKDVFDNGFSSYQECKHCKTRRVIQPDSGYQPVDVNWVTFTTDETQESHQKPAAPGLDKA